MHDRSPMINIWKTNTSDACSRRESDASFNLAQTTLLTAKSNKRNGKDIKILRVIAEYQSLRKAYLYVHTQHTAAASDSLMRFLKSLHLDLVFILIKKANTLSDEYLFALYVVAIDAAAAELTSARLSAHGDESKQRAEKNRKWESRCALMMMVIISERWKFLWIAMIEAAHRSKPKQRWEYTESFENPNKLIERYKTVDSVKCIMFNSK